MDGTYIGSLSSTERKLVSREIANNTQFALGRLYYVRDRCLMAQAFDVKKVSSRERRKLLCPKNWIQIPPFFGRDIPSLIMVQWSSSQPRITFLT